jgi:hypothetical protein
MVSAALSKDKIERKKVACFAGSLLLSWLLIKAALILCVTGARTENLYGGPIRIVYNLNELIRPWDWPALAFVYIPPIVSCYLLWKSRQVNISTWSVACIVSFAILFVFANTTEQRAFADLIGLYAIVCTIFLLRVVFSDGLTDRMMVRWPAPEAGSALGGEHRVQGRAQPSPAGRRAPEADALQQARR